MNSKLTELIRQGNNLLPGKEQELVKGFEDFEQWRQDCVEFIESLRNQFHEEVQTPRNIEQGLRFLESNFGQSD